MRAQEFDNPKDTFIEMFRKFLPIAMEIIGLQSLPKMVFEKEIYSPNQPTFGQYINNEHILYVGLSNRHPNDILRTVAHELVHYKQDLLDQLNDMSGATGSPEENQANAVAGMVMRNFNKRYPEYLKTKPIIAEDMKYVLVDYRGNYYKGIDKFYRNLSTRDLAEAEKFNSERDAKDIALWTRNRFKVIPWSGHQRVAETIHTAKEQNTQAGSFRFRWATQREKDTDNAKFVYDVGNGARLLFVPSNGDVYVAPPGRSAELIVRTGDNRNNIIKTVDQFPDYIPMNIRQAILDYHIAVRGKKTEEEQMAVAIDMANKIDALTENFADGRNPQDKGDSARHGIRKGMTIAQLKKIRSSNSASPRKKQLAHWQINMRQGRKK